MSYYTASSIYFSTFFLGLLEASHQPLPIHAVDAANCCASTASSYAPPVLVWTKKEQNPRHTRASRCRRGALKQVTDTRVPRPASRRRSRNQTVHARQYNNNHAPPDLRCENIMGGRRLHDV